MNETGARKRRGRRIKDRHANAFNNFEQKPFKQLIHRYPSVSIASDDEVQAIHHASLKLLERTGINVLHERSRQIMHEAGALVKPSDTRVYFDPALIMELITHVPSEFTLHARNPDHHVKLGGKNLVFNMMASAPNASCLDKGRRSGNKADYQDFLKLSQVHNIIHLNAGYPVEPTDVHPSVRHLDCIYDLITLTDKSYGIYSLGRQRNLDGIEMTRIARGLTHEQMREQPSVFSVINTNSPLQLDIPMMQGIIEMARMRQPVVITPFTLAGAMAPVTIAGAVVLQNAEALAAIAFSQMVCKGAPAMYGGFTSNVDMKSGSPAFGTPEYMKAQHLGGQLARLYKIPYRTSNVCAANTVDAQAAYESVFSLWGAINSGMNMLMHSSGWMEGGLCCSFEKVMVDIDLLQMVAEFLEPLDFSNESLALDAIDEVGPGGHYFGCEHTQKRYKNAFYSPLISDWRNYETWFEDGGPNAMQTANRIYKQRLANYEKPTIDPAILEELDEFVAKRKSQGGVATDF